MAEEVFGEKPMVISLPHRHRIRPEDAQFDHITFLLVSTDSRRLEAIRARFDKGESFWINPEPPENDAINAFRVAAPASNWQRIAPAQFDLASDDRMPIDDWPQLYLRSAEIPCAPTGQAMVAVAVLSFSILLAIAPRPRARSNS